MKLTFISDTHWAFNRQHGAPIRQHWDSYSIHEQRGITFINACTLNEYYRVVNLLIEYTLVGENL